MSLLTSAIWFIIWLCAVWAVVGLLIYLLREAFFLPEAIKPWARFFLIAIGVLATCVLIVQLAQGNVPRVNFSAAPAIESIG